MESLIAVALALWLSVGSFIAPHITIIAQDANPAYQQVRSNGWAYIISPTECEISILERNIIGWDTQARQNLITHEVGHCIGLDHIAGEGLMRDPGFDFSPADAAEFRRTHPLPIRGHIGALSFD